MANTLLTPDMITLEALVVLKNQLNFTRNVNRQYDPRFAQSGAKIGDTLDIRLPVRYTVSDGQAIDIQDATETKVPLVLDKQKHVAMEFSSKELTLDISDFSRQFIVPAIAALANKIDDDGMQEYQNVYASVGTPATVPSSLLTFLQAGQKLDEMACPVDGQRAVVLTPATQATMVNALTGLFQSASQIKRQYETGRMGTAAGFEWSMDQNAATHTVATHSGTPLTNGAGQTGSSLITDGWTSGSVTLNKGDVFTVAGVNAVNPQNRRSTGALQQFVVQEDISDTTGDMTISISPSIITSGPFQTVDAAPADGVAITIVGATGVSSPQNLAFHRDAFTLGMADLVKPQGVDFASVKSDKDLGISIRCVRQYDIRTDQYPCRLDVIYGWKTVRPELACRIQS